MLIWLWFLQIIHAIRGWTHTECGNMGAAYLSNNNRMIDWATACVRKPPTQVQKQLLPCATKQPEKTISPLHIEFKEPEESKTKRVIALVDNWLHMCGREKSSRFRLVKWTDDIWS